MALRPHTHAAASSAARIVSLTSVAAPAVL